MRFSMRWHNWISRSIQNYVMPVSLRVAPLQPVWPTFLDMEIIGRIQGGSRGPLRYADYHFVNTMFQFWYQFVFPNLEEINCGQGQYIYDTVAKPALDNLI